jgi:putative tricarboxylic transport membrane protein
MRARLTTDLLTGFLFLALGGFVLIYGTRYPIGSAVRMGPGYFPRIISSGLVLLGFVLVARAALRGGERVGAVAVRPLLLVLVGTFAFGLLIERAGFWAASIVLVCVSRLVERDLRVAEIGGLALVLTAIITVIFRYGLGLPIRLLPF